MGLCECALLLLLLLLLPLLVTHCVSHLVLLLLLLLLFPLLLTLWVGQLLLLLLLLPLLVGGALRELMQGIDRGAVRWWGGREIAMQEGGKYVGPGILACIIFA